MIGTSEVSQNRYNHVQGIESLDSSDSLVSRINSAVKNCSLKRAAQGFFIGSATLVTIACLSNPFGITIGVLTTAFIVSTLALSALIMEFIGLNQKTDKETVEGRPSLIQNDFLVECRLIDLEKRSPNGAISNLYIDSLHDRVKNEILGTDLLDQIQDFSLRHPEREKDIVALKNILILKKAEGVSVSSYSDSLKYNLEQLSADIARGRKIKFEGEIISSTDIEVAGFDGLIEEFERPEIVKMILQSIEAKFPNLPLAQKNALVANLHHGSFYDFEKDLNEDSIGIQDVANTNVTRNTDGSFSIEMDLLLKVIGDPSKAPLISQDNDYKREIAAKFGIKSLGDHAFRSIAGTTTGFIRLDTQFDNKYVHLNPIPDFSNFLN